MQWEQLTAPRFAEAVRETGVCVLPMGVLERHSEHLPLGTDYLNAHKVSCLAAERQAAVVFPPFYFGQIYEARCFPGAVGLRPTLLIELLQGVIDEIGRNGFPKVILYSGHGGNNHLVRFLAQCTLYEEKPYSVYLPDGRLTPERAEQWRALCETDEHGHACECETSVSLANHPELVRMEDVPAAPGAAMKRTESMRAFTGIGWYGNYPEHYAGDARPATAEKGEALRELQVATLAEFIAAVKADTVVPALEREFFARSRAMTGR